MSDVDETKRQIIAILDKYIQADAEFLLMSLLMSLPMVDELADLVSTRETEAYKKGYIGGGIAVMNDKEQREG